MDALQNIPYCYVDIYIGNVENFQFNVYEYIFIHLANMDKIESISTSRFLVEFKKLFIASVYGLVIANFYSIFKFHLKSSVHIPLSSLFELHAQRVCVRMYF
jgi:hypothetical protein